MLRDTMNKGNATFFLAREVAKVDVLGGGLLGSEKVKFWGKF